MAARSAFVIAALACIGLGSAWGAEFSLVVDTKLAVPSQLALADLEQALQLNKHKTTRADTLANDKPAIVIGTADSPTVQRLLKTHDVTLAKPAESLCIKKLGKVLLIAGRDPRGLSYALLEVARAIELAADDIDIFNAVTEANEEPFLRQRSMTIHPFNADLEEEWYFDKNFWKSYFTLLARSRYNNFTLTFSDQTNYLNPIYPYLVEVPGHPRVKVKGLSDAARKRQLDMLGAITELAHERGLDFTLGIWTQLPVEKYTAKILVENLPVAKEAADFCAAGLKQILKECPAIDAVQFRMNSEAGVPEDQQNDFYRPLFRAIADCGRPVRLDLRYKGLRPETIQSAVDLKIDVTVSTKFWCEHMGLPYHPTVVDSHYREGRYSFGSMLKHDRKYRVVYQLWTVGSQRLLLWGDPHYAAKFARSCKLGDGEGFEVFAPLTNKGFGNQPGNWRIFADKTLETSKWEHERYWFFYLAFGRQGYNPQTDPEVWQRELRSRFGKAADAVESAYRHASQIIPLLTATHQLSAGEWMWWPEMDTGDRLPEYMRAQPSDPSQFYAIRTWKRTPNWRTEEWDDHIHGYVEDAVAGNLGSKWTPIQVGRRLRDLSDQTRMYLVHARHPFEGFGIRPPKVPELESAIFRATELDMMILALLARYHAYKTFAATQLAFFEITGEIERLPLALKHMRVAEADWEQIVKLVDGAYNSNLVFGYSPGDGRKLGHHHSGNWKDRLPEVREDVAFIEKLIEKHGNKGKPSKEYAGERQSDPPEMSHRPVTTVVVGADVALDFQVTSKNPLREVRLHYRPLNQKMDWKSVLAKESRPGHFQAVIPAKDIAPEWDLQYFLEVLLDEGGGRRLPSWENGPPYFVVKVGKPATK